MLIIAVDIPDNPGALTELEVSLKDGGLDDLREMFMYMAQVAESAIEVEVKRNGRQAEEQAGA